jgi:hypothetical protein
MNPRKTNPVYDPVCWGHAEKQLSILKPHTFSGRHVTLIFKYIGISVHGLLKKQHYVDRMKDELKRHEIAGPLNDATCWKNNTSQIATDLPGF